jgi:hypothetical protein
MSNELGNWVSGALIAAKGGRVQGNIVRVGKHQIWNPFARKSEPTIVIEFAGGHRLAPSKTMIAELISRFGKDSEGWIGQVIALGCKWDDRNKRWQKVLLPEDEPAWVTEDDADDETDEKEE